MKKIIAIIGLLIAMEITNISSIKADDQPITNTDAPITNTTRAGLSTPSSLNLNESEWNKLGPGVTTIEDLLQRIINWLILIAAPIAAGMVVYGAYQMLFAAGEPEKVKAGRNTILYTVIGYGIILISWGVVSIVENFLRGG